MVFEVTFSLVNTLTKTMLTAACLLLLNHAGLARSIAYQDSDGRWQYVNSLQSRKNTPPRQITKIQKSGGPAFYIDYGDVDAHNGIGFDDPALGATRRATVNAVFAYLAEILDEPGSCDVRWTASQQDGTGALARMGNSYSIDSSDPRFDPGLSFQHLVTGFDPWPGDDEMHGMVDFGYKWNCDLGPPAVDEMDLFTVILHEASHGLGVMSLSRDTGISAVAPNCFSTFDNLLYTGTGSKMWNANAQLAVPVDALIGQQEGVFFHGPTAASLLGRFPKIYAPNPFSDSSLSHLDGAVFPTQITMEQSIAFGVMVRKYQPFEIGILIDLGYHFKGTTHNAASQWACYE